MNQATTAKLALAASGLIVWGLGVRNGDATLTWLGIAMLVVAVILRFIRPAKRH